MGEKIDQLYKSMNFTSENVKEYHAIQKVIENIETNKPLNKDQTDLLKKVYDNNKNPQLWKNDKQMEFLNERVNEVDTQLSALKVTFGDKVSSLGTATKKVVSGVVNEAFNSIGVTAKKVGIAVESIKNELSSSKNPKEPIDIEMINFGKKQKEPKQPLPGVIKDTKEIIESKGISQSKDDAHLKQDKSFMDHLVKTRGRSGAVSAGQESFAEKIKQERSKSQSGNLGK